LAVESVTSQQPGGFLPVIKSAAFSQLGGILPAVLFIFFFRANSKPPWGFGVLTPKNPWGVQENNKMKYYFFRESTPKPIKGFRGPTLKIREPGVLRTVCRQSSGCPQNLGVGTPKFGSCLTKPLFFLNNFLA
jgi:hypothetical protein